MTMLHLIVLLACANDTEPAVVAPNPIAAQTPHWETRTDLELDEVLAKSCEASIADGKPLLVEFSAPWCVDCRKLEALETDDALAKEYGNWHRVRVDVGRFDLHDDLRGAFGVTAIAHWTAMKPTSCEAKAQSWPRLKSAVMELETGSIGPRTASDLIDWLAAARG